MKGTLCEGEGKGVTGEKGGVRRREFKWIMGKGCLGTVMGVLCKVMDARGRMRKGG